MGDRGCCGPSAGRTVTSVPDQCHAATYGARSRSEAVGIPGGTALVGTDTPLILNDGEGPLRRKRTRAFQMSTTAVTNADFAAFVDDTGYRTEAERFGWSFVFWAQLPGCAGPDTGIGGLEWWHKVDGATWSTPLGPGSEAACLPDHPVVHVSWNDATVFATWAGGRLPTEAEWEHAARGGLGDVAFPWGDEAPDDTTHLPCNIWQGDFPHSNTAADGYRFTAPARSFERNAFGLYNMVGNVWEWTSEPFQIKSLKRDIRARMAASRGDRLSKGGSFLCHRSYCYRYRIAARSGSSPCTTTTHQGFRLVWDD